MWTLITLKVIAYLKILLLRYRLKVQLPKNPSSRSLDLKIQSQSIEKPLLCPTSMNQGRLPTKIRGKNILRRNGIKKTLFRPQKIMSLKVRRNRTIKMTKSAIIIKKRAILLGTTWNL